MSDDESDAYWRGYEDGYRDADAERKSARADESRQLRSNPETVEDATTQYLRDRWPHAY